MSAYVPQTLLINFLERSGLHNTSTLLSQHKVSLPKNQLLSDLAHTKVDLTQQDTCNQLRNYYQTTDPNALKKFIQRVKNAPQNKLHQIAKNLKDKPFFRRILQEKQNMHANSEPQSLLDESVRYQNEWAPSQYLGYDIYVVKRKDLKAKTKQIAKRREYPQKAVKKAEMAANYQPMQIRKSQSLKTNVHDGLPTRFPTNAKHYRSPEHPEYPVSEDQTAFACFDLDVIYDRCKTGFEQSAIKIVLDSVIAARYRLVSVLGQAQFSKAVGVKALNSDDESMYCLKIVQNSESNQADQSKKEYFDQALDEIKILQYIQKNCDVDKYSLVKFYDCFYHKEHLFIRTQLLKENLYQVYSDEYVDYFTLLNVQIIAKQLFTALAKLHQLHIIHSDVKPENILIKSYTKCQIKLIDMGSSVFSHDDPLVQVQTMTYRAPQVILGCPYGQQIDVWSAGCVIAQLLMRRPIFDASSQAAIIALMQGLRGPWPSWMLEKGSRTNQFFTQDLVIFEQPEPKQDPDTYHIYVPKNTNIQARLGCDDEVLVDFLSRCLKLDPCSRMTCKEALDHPFLTRIF